MGPAATVGLLAHVSDDPERLAWQPHAKSMSLGGLATHISNLPVWGGTILGASFFDLATLPLYVRAGAILPLGPVRQYVGENSHDPLELVIHPGADGRFLLYEDDGETFDYRRGRYRLIELRWEGARRRLTVAPATGRSAPSDPLPPVPRRFDVRIAGRHRHAELRYDGRHPTALTL